MPLVFLTNHKLCIQINRSCLTVTDYQVTGQLCAQSFESLCISTISLVHRAYDTVSAVLDIVQKALLQGMYVLVAMPRPSLDSLVVGRLP